MKIPIVTLKQAMALGVAWTCVFVAIAARGRQQGQSDATVFAVPQGADEVIGKTAFDVVATTETEARIVPLAMPSFIVQRMNAATKLPLGFTQCLVVRRVIYTDELQKRFFTVTVLRCGAKEYAVGEVDFQMSQPEGGKK